MLPGALPGVRRMQRHAQSQSARTHEAGPLVKIDNKSGYYSVIRADEAVDKRKIAELWLLGLLSPSRAERLEGR